MFLMRVDTFWAPNGIRLRLDAISQGPKNLKILFKQNKNNLLNAQSFIYNFVYHRERILETSTLSCNEEEEEITKPPKR